MIELFELVIEDFNMLELFPFYSKKMNGHGLYIEQFYCQVLQLHMRQ